MRAIEFGIDESRLTGMMSSRSWRAFERAHSHRGRASGVVSGNKPCLLIVVKEGVARASAFVEKKEGRSKERKVVGKRESKTKAHIALLKREKV